MKDDKIEIDQLDIEIRCPKCDNDLVHDNNTLPMAQSRNGAMFECGQCQEVTQWKFTLDPFMLERVDPIVWGGRG